MENPELEMAFAYAQYTHRNIFLTGKAGTGKTTFLRRLQQVSQKRMIIVAPTGVAAINAGGVTIHSFFQLAPGMHLPGQNIGGREKQSKFQFSKHKINILRSLDLLVIDEVSMVRCDLLDAIDEVLRRYQNRYQPFGGVQLLLIGDLQQLAPVAKEEEWQILKDHGYTTQYFFGSKALWQTPYTTIELKKVYRQADHTFVNLLNQVRDNRLTPEGYQALNARYRANFRPSDDEGYITLTTHNYQAADINAMRLTLLPTQPVKYRAKLTGDFPETSYPTDEELTLKIGAQVMFCKNDPLKQYYNGKIGRVVKCDNERVWVECGPDSLDPSDESQIKTLEVTAQEWQNTRYVTNQKTGEITEEVIGTFSQIPLKTAWAITIHKSQGLTFDRAIIQADRAFSPGQVYVALSRCRSLEGLVLSTPIPPSAITVDNLVLQYNDFVEKNQPTHDQLAQDCRSCVEEILCRIFDYSQLQMRFNYVTRLCEEYLSRLYPNFVNRMKLLRDEIEGLSEAQKRQSPVVVGNTFQHVIHEMIPLAPEFEDNTALKQRLSKGFAWFLNRTAELLQDLMDDGLPEIDNKAHREQLDKEFALLRNDYDLKIQIFTNCMSGFSLDAYWDAKAIANMNADDPEKAKKQAAKKPAKKAKPEKKKVAENDDVQNQELFEDLREWRNQKAADLKLPAYCVLPNAVLLAITNFAPMSEKELLDIHGISKRIVQAYGAELIGLVIKHSRG